MNFAEIYRDMTDSWFDYYGTNFGHTKRGIFGRQKYTRAEKRYAYTFVFARLLSEWREDRKNRRDARRERAYQDRQRRKDRTSGLLQREEEMTAWEQKLSRWQVELEKREQLLELKQKRFNSNEIQTDPEDFAQKADWMAAEDDLPDSEMDACDEKTGCDSVQLSSIIDEWQQESFLSQQESF